MIINDTEHQIKTAVYDGLEKAQDGYLRSCETEVKDRIHTARLSDPARLGTPLWPSELEAKLKRLNANLLFEVIAENPTHKRLSVVDQRGKHSVAVYENSLMPERSIPRLRTVEVPDPKFTHIDRKDLPKDPDALRPGWRRVTIPWGEAKRGWRTVLVRLIGAGLITVTQAETEFGSDETPEWRQYTGKGDFTTPF